MALQRHLWYTGWALVTLERIIGNFILSSVMARNPYLPNYAFPRQPHGLAEAPVVHCLGLVNVAQVTMECPATSPTPPP